MKFKLAEDDRKAYLAADKKDLVDLIEACKGQIETYKKLFKNTEEIKALSDRENNLLKEHIQSLEEELGAFHQIFAPDTSSS